MGDKLKLPYPMLRMFEHLDIDVEASEKLIPKQVEHAIRTCEVCKAFHQCDYDVESRYFTCPNRDIFDQLEDLLSKN